MGTFETIIAMNAAKKAVESKQEKIKQVPKAESEYAEDEDSKKETKQELSSKFEEDSPRGEDEEKLFKQTLINSKIKDRFGDENALVSVREMNEIQREADFEFENRKVIDGMAKEALKERSGDNLYSVKDLTIAKKEALQQLLDKKKNDEKQLKNIRENLSKM